MRKLIVSMNCTLDGFISGPNCEMDWHLKYWDVAIGKLLCRELTKADTVLMGKTTFNVFSKFADPVARPSITGSENFSFFDMLNRYQKIVFSTTLQQVGWPHSTICHTNIREKIIDLKKLPGKNIMLYGSAKLLHYLQPLDLIDVYQLFFHPVVLGNGKRLFAGHSVPGEFELLCVEKFSAGVVFIELTR